jgi:hypothetical protein
VASNPALALGPFVSVDLETENGLPGPHVTFSGCNLHVINGMGQTYLTNGLGNILVGYDESPADAPLLTVAPYYTPLNTATVLQPGDRNGSHNLIIGSWHRFTTRAFGGLVAGEFNTISSEADSITGGLLNSTNLNGGSRFALIAGGVMNTSGGGDFCAILGGEFCGTGGASFGTVIGGSSAHTQGYYAERFASAPV